MNKVSAVILCAAFLIAGCSAGGPDGPFHPAGKKIIFTEIIDSRASTVILTAGNTNEASIVPLTELLQSGESLEKPSVAQSRIMSAAQPKNFAVGLGMGFREVMLGLGAVETKESRMASDQYVAEITLMRCEVKETEVSVLLLVEAESAITHRMSGDRVWSESGEDRIELKPLRDGKRVENATVKELAALLSGPEEDVAEAVKAATAQLGRELGQRVRKTPTKWDVAPGR